MANIGTLLKQEITKLARRETRKDIASMRKASAQYRRDIAALKRESTALIRKVSLLADKVLVAPSRPEAGAPGERPMRFVPKGLRSHRAKLGLSANEYGQLAGVSGQSIYNWERASATPRSSQLDTLAALRRMGKREALARLEQLGAKPRRKS